MRVLGAERRTTQWTLIEHREWTRALVSARGDVVWYGQGDFLHLHIMSESSSDVVNLIKKLGHVDLS